jgi:hypothetical protein
VSEYIITQVLENSIWGWEIWYIIMKTFYKKADATDPEGW